MRSEKLAGYAQAKACADVSLAPALTAANAISGRTLSALAASIARYDDIPCAKKGILDSLNPMLRRILLSGDSQAADAAADFFAVYFGKKRVVATIHSAVASIVSMSKSSKTVVQNLKNAFDDDKFAVEHNNSGGKQHADMPGEHGSKTKTQFKITYDAAGAEKNLERIRAVYANYPKFIKFFSEHGFKVKPIPILINKTLFVNVAGTGLAENEAFAVFSYYNSASGKISMARSTPMYYAIHELSHHLQNRYHNNKRTGKRNRLPPPGIDAVLSQEHIFKLIISEAGAKFAEKLYRVSCRDKCPTAKKNIRSMANEGEGFLFSVPESTGAAQAKFIEGRHTEFLKLLNVIYNGLEKTHSSGNSPETGLIKLLWSKIEEYPTERVYGIGLAVATLTYAANGYDSDKTLHDLIDPEARVNLLGKLANTIKSGECPDMMAGLHSMLRRGA